MHFRDIYIFAKCIAQSVLKLNLTNIVINEALSRGRGGSGATVHAWYGLKASLLRI